MCMFISVHLSEVARDVPSHIADGLALDQVHELGCTNVSEEDVQSPGDRAIPDSVDHVTVSYPGLNEDWRQEAELIDLI